MEGYLAGHREVDGMLVRYEDLVGGAVSVSDLSSFAHVDCDASVLLQNVSGRGTRELVRLPPLEARILALAVSPLARRLGYTL
jgi:ribosomal protein S18 acetylase RimI-like enzyme